MFRTNDRTHQGGIGTLTELLKLRFTHSLLQAMDVLLEAHPIRADLRERLRYLLARVHFVAPTCEGQSTRTPAHQVLKRIGAPRPLITALQRSLVSVPKLFALLADKKFSCCALHTQQVKPLAAALQAYKIEVIDTSSISRVECAFSKIRNDTGPAQQGQGAAQSARPPLVQVHGCEPWHSLHRFIRVGPPHIRFNRPSCADRCGN